MTLDDQKPLPKSGDFKTCPNCGFIWTSQAEFFDDPDLRFLGYQAFVKGGVLGIYLFNHLTCETTLGISAEQFADLIPGPLYRPSTGPLEKSEHCLAAAEGLDCPEGCECEAVKQVIEVILTTSSGRD